MTNYLISIIGPTAIGKTSCAIQLAEHFKTEIISADSRQFYKEMNIGTAVPSPEELNRIPHHFIQHISIHQEYDVGDFEREVLRKLEDLFERFNPLISVGGSGLFVDAISKGLSPFPRVDPEIRLQLNHRYETEGIGYLQSELQKADPEYYEQVDLHNPRRLIRALEVYHSSGRPYSYYRQKKSLVKRDFKTLKIGLTAPREIIYQRIEKRVGQMMEDGLLEEVKALYPFRKNKALNTIGYKELFAYLDGETDLASAVEEIKKNTRRFAKRQLTWFKKDPDIQWFSYDSPNAAIRSYITRSLL